jgi:orotate phosphoribosyltransferase
VLIVDDVITAGTAVREALALITQAGGTPVAIAIALDREEVVDADAAVRESAAQAVAREYGLAVVAVAGLSDLLAFAGQNAELVAQREQLLAYRSRYGCQAA